MDTDTIDNRSATVKLPPRPPTGQPIDHGKTPQQTDEAAQPSSSAQATELENAKAVLDQLKFIVDDAVFLDDETFGGMKNLDHYSRKLQVAQKRMKQLSHQLLAAQAHLARKDEQIKEVQEQKRKVEEELENLQQELDNNQVVFEVHYKEIMQRNAEIERLKSVIEGLGSAGVSQ